MDQAKPNILVIVGITGDLSRNKLLPALYHLEQDNLLPENFRIVGTSRNEVNIDDFFEGIMSSIIKVENDCQEQALDRLKSKTSIYQIDMNDNSHYQTLAKVLADKEAETSTCATHLFYLAIPPSAIPEIIEMIGHAEVHKCSHGENGKVLIEKPFGRDLESARNLSRVVEDHFSEDQIYRIDHFLAKETAQNILHFRFFNPLVKDIWDKKYVDNIQIIAAETSGAEGRANFYEQTGALRDMMQSHLLQLAALTTMEIPEEFDAEHVRASRQKLLSTLRPLDMENIENISARGQYDNYRQDVDNPDSNVETFAALKLEIQNERWRNVPIYLRTGKRLKTKVTEITLVYKDTDDKDSEDLNLLTIRIQPSEAIEVILRVKKPGLDNSRQDVVMDYVYERSDDKIIHSAYEKLLIDAMGGDQMLFQTDEEVLKTWEFIDPLLEYWQSLDSKPEVYPSGSWGPKGASKLLEEHGDLWVKKNKN